MTVATTNHHQYLITGECQVSKQMVSRTCSCGVTTLERFNPAVVLSYKDAVDWLDSLYYTKRVTFLETAPSYSHGGLPEESVDECNTCFREWGDGHEDDCINKEAFEAIANFIERVF